MYLYLLQTIREDVAEFKCNTNFAKVSTFVFVVHVNVLEFSCNELQSEKIFDVPAALKRMDRGQKCVREAKQIANTLLFPFFHSCLCLSLCPVGENHLRYILLLTVLLMISFSVLVFHQVTASFHPYPWSFCIQRNFLFLLGTVGSFKFSSEPIGICYMSQTLSVIYQGSLQKLSL